MLNYIKVLVLNVSDFESTIVDEWNFQLGDESKIQQWINEHTDNDNICIRVEMESRLMIKS